MSNTTVNYRTPIGNFQTWEEAAIACERCGLDPVECIKAEVSPSEISHIIDNDGVSRRLSTPIRCF